ncbi:MAG: EAL domain-containing protein [Campylobacterales bacterium]
MTPSGMITINHGRCPLSPEYEHCCIGVAEQASTIDTRTNLPNLKGLMNILSRTSEQLTLLILKLDNVYNIKQFLGRSYSDAFINNLLEVLPQITLKYDHNLQFFRIAYDELAILTSIPLSEAEKLCSDVGTLTKHFVAQHNNINLNSLITIGGFRSTSNLLAKAETTLVRALFEQRGGWILAQDGNERSDLVRDNVEWLTIFSEAVEQENLVAFYQPIAEIKTGKIAKYECLARIYHQGQLITPDRFVELAHATGLSTFITRTMIRRTYELFAKHPQIEFSINISPSDFKDQTLLKFIDYWQQKVQLDPARVTFEILEAENAYDCSWFRSIVRELKARGYMIAVDDFGTGYSNFVTLMESNVDFFKIDGTLIKDLHTDPSKIPIVSSIAQIIKTLGAKSVAEYVSNQEIYDIIRQIGIDYAQGYAIGKPVEKIVESHT